MTERCRSSVPKRAFLCSRSDQKKETSAAVLPSKVPIIGLGCSSFSSFFWTNEELAAETNDGQTKTAITAEALTRDHPKVQEWIETIRYAILDCGISLLDTAPWYGHGTSEIVVGWALKESLSGSDADSSNSKLIDREDLCVNTKVGRYEADPTHQFDFSRTATLESVQRSLQRMNCGYIDVLQLHDPEFSPTLEILLKETIPAMVECRSNGWCKALGLTGYPLEVQYQILQHSLETYGGEESVRIWDQALTYGHFNLHDASLVRRRISPSCESFAECCHQSGMGLLAAAPLSMGLLTNNIPPDWHPANGSELAKACLEAARICRDLDVDIAILALLFSMSHPSVPCTILGMKDVEQVEKASAVARRFAMVDWTIPDLSQELVLSFVLTVPESKAYRILSDREAGPFAEVWKRETAEDYDGNGIFAPKFQWDGVREAHEFWRTTGQSFEDWQDKSFQ
ncbi:unnamed protein product [Pseudo-nitzschia multistriata]|uniref:NADP-dependent oxidoreductase domain-containing protein n=1 Tax=Pseudo-nitzschia multistriata TaxID=183589 RepID=A0A448Z0K0_9STRA|nr:unnamed protein product [Pseudo-nitzschia multistriata]